ncbi:Protein of unknown function D [Prunus dulcis]|uniref:Uncharacterized protein n=1 Tax=Prunus dulcis TaxID=3755 RepID=A0A5H2XIT6_PRUDU|nr:Protein of unknown function D [Prunus dulcis]
MASIVLKVGIMPRLCWCGKLEDGRLSCFKWQRSLGEEIANFQLKFDSKRKCRRILLMYEGGDGDENGIPTPDSTH